MAVWVGPGRLGPVPAVGRFSPARGDRVSSLDTATPVGLAGKCAGPAGVPRPRLPADGKQSAEQERKPEWGNQDNSRAGRPQPACAGELLLREGFAAGRVSGNLPFEWAERKRGWHVRAL